MRRTTDHLVAVTKVVDGLEEHHIAALITSQAGVAGDQFELRYGGSSWLCL